jgi:hypothetical protein
MGTDCTMSDEPQDMAEQLDTDMLDDDPVLSDEVPLEVVPDELRAVPFADADVTDESFAERTAQEEPEVWQRRPGHDPADEAGVPNDERLRTVIDVGADDEDGG